MKVAAPELPFSVAAALVAVAVLGVLLWRGSKTVGAAVDAVSGVVSHQLNPASSDNVVNQGVTAVGAAVTGDSAWTLGGSIYDATHDASGQPLTYANWARNFWGIKSNATDPTAAANAAETASLLARYPAPVSVADPGSVSYDAMGNVQGW